MERIVMSQQIGTKRIMGTDHPVYLWLVRNGPKDWRVQISCNGIDAHDQGFKTKWEAEEYFLIRESHAGAEHYNEEMTACH
jgi:hypothetical protein